MSQDTATSRQPHSGQPVGGDTGQLVNVVDVVIYCGHLHVRQFLEPSRCFQIESNIADIFKLNIDVFIL